MNKIDLEINNTIMREIGLEVGLDKRIVDQDTGVGLSFKGMDVVAPGSYCGRNSIEFDPYNNKKMMNLLFGYFLDKYSDESDNSVAVSYSVNGEDKNKAAIECRMADMSKIRSGEYMRESLRCTDIIMQLNGEENPDLHKYDLPKENETIKKRVKSNAANKSNRKTATNSK